MHNVSTQLAGKDFTALYQELAPRILRYLMRICQDTDLAEDILQETFLSMYKNRAGFQERSSVATWAYKIATNKLIDRRRSFWVKVNSDSALMEKIPCHSLNPERKAIVAQEIQKLKDALDNLPIHQKTALLLVRVEGLKYRVAAEVLNVSLSTVRMRVYRGLLALKGSLGGSQDDQ